MISRIKPLISSNSTSQVVDQAVVLGERYIDRMQEAKEEYDEIERKIEELRDRQERLKDKWETEQIKFSDI